MKMSLYLLGSLFLAILFSSFFLDKIFLEFFLQIQNPQLNLFFQFITFFGSFFLLLLLFFWSFFHWVFTEKFISLPSFLFFSVSLSWLITKVLKIVLGKARPELFVEQGISGFTFFSFSELYQALPSGHTTLAFALATSLFFFYPKYRLFFFFYAMLIALSRLILFEHYLSDVLAGAFIGILIPFLLKLHYEKRGKSLSSLFPR